MMYSRFVIASTPRIMRHVWLLCLLTVPPGTLRAEEAKDGSASFFQQYCVDCHTGPNAENGFDINQLGSDFQRQDVMARWVRLFDRVERNEMPPSDSELPSPQVVLRFWLHSAKNPFGCFGFAGEYRAASVESGRIRKHT